MKKLLIGLAIITIALIPGSRIATSEVCYHGCSSLDVDVLDYVRITQPSEIGCSPSCGGGGGYQYRIVETNGCGGDEGSDGTFCTDENISEGYYQVNAIGAGCAGTPQGCVRLCPCQ